MSSTKNRRRLGTQVEKDAVAALAALRENPERWFSTDSLSSGISVLGRLDGDLVNYQRIRRAMAWLMEHDTHSLQVERRGRGSWRYRTPARAIQEEAEKYVQEEHREQGEKLAVLLRKVVGDTDENGSEIFAHGYRGVMAQVWIRGGAIAPILAHLQQTVK